MTPRKDEEKFISWAELVFGLHFLLLKRPDGLFPKAREASLLVSKMLRIFSKKKKRKILSIWLD